MEVYQWFSQRDTFNGLLVEEMVSAIELITGTKTDYQFGPIVLLGMGGTATEIYRDVSLRMAPLKAADVAFMVKCLKAHELLEGCRGSDSVNLPKLAEVLQTFSGLVMDL
jgi:hypothetical protein